VNELFDSIKNALNYFGDVDLTINLCLNSQTNLSNPINGAPEEMFEVFKNHEIYKMAKIVFKTNSDKFFNIADWRREYYNENGFTVWGESDCLLPQEFFHTLDYMAKEIAQEPYFITFAHKKMFDKTWNCIEHPSLVNGTLDDWHKKDMKLCCDGYISQLELDEFNSNHETSITQHNVYKSDGALIVLSKGFKRPFICPDINIWGDDICFTKVCEFKKIPQYFVTLMKGHNIRHPQKKSNCIDVFSKEEIDAQKIESFRKIFAFYAKVLKDIRLKMENQI
jgi:hypothetical protein